MKLIRRPLCGKLAAALFLLAVIVNPAHAQLPVVATDLHVFAQTNDASYPVGSLQLGPDNFIYGTTYAETNNPGYGGAIFRIGRDGSGYSVIHNFSADETGDLGYLTIGYDIGLSITREVNGVMYGAIFNGGTNDTGAVFKMNTDGTGYTIIHSFGQDGSPYSLMMANDGVLYGAGNTIFKLFNDGSGYTVLHTFSSADGSRPTGNLVQGPDGEVYGTCQIGGVANNGTIFKIDPAGTNFSVLHLFTNSPEGSQPTASVILGADGALYGATANGGSNGFGTVFKINTDGSHFQTLYSFGVTPADGARPRGAFTQDLNGVLYGTTSQSQASNGTNSGTVFEINPDGSGYASIFQFNNNFGDEPYGGLVQGSFQNDSGIYYGTTFNQGLTTNSTFGHGSIFALTINPLLTITPSVNLSGTNAPVIFWPAWAINYELQSATNLTSPKWQAVTNGFPLFGYQLSNSSPQSFYRLVFP